MSQLVGASVGDRVGARGSSPGSMSNTVGEADGALVTQVGCSIVFLTAKNSSFDHGTASLLDGGILGQISERLMEKSDSAGTAGSI